MTYTVTGLVATTPRFLESSTGTQVTSFRLATTNTGTVNSDNEVTNWFTIVSLGDLALNSMGTLAKGDRVVVTGNLVIRDWDNGERTGTSVEIKATAIGQDLNYGTSVFTRTTIASRQENA